jgi:hypothetical protein
MLFLLVEEAGTGYGRTYFAMYGLAESNKYGRIERATYGHEERATRNRHAPSAHDFDDDDEIKYFPDIVLLYQKIVLVLCIGKCVCLYVCRDLGLGTCGGM